MRLVRLEKNESPFKKAGANRRCFESSLIFPSKTQPQRPLLKPLFQFIRDFSKNVFSIDSAPLEFPAHRILNQDTAESKLLPIYLSGPKLIMTKVLQYCWLSAFNCGLLTSIDLALMMFYITTERAFVSLWDDHSTPVDSGDGYTFKIQQ